MEYGYGIRNAYFRIKMEYGNGIWKIRYAHSRIKMEMEYGNGIWNTERLFQNKNVNGIWNTECLFQNKNGIWNTECLFQNGHGNGIWKWNMECLFQNEMKMVYGNGIWSTYSRIKMANAFAAAPQPFY